MSIETIRPNPESFVLHREKHKAELDRVLVDSTVNIVRECARMYGGNADIDLKETQLHFVPEESKHPGQANPNSQNILIASGENVIDKAKVLLHEILHHFSWQSFYVDESGKSKTHRLGVRIRRKDGSELFDDHNEAITETLAIRLLPTLAEAVPELAEALRVQQSLVERLDRERFETKIPEIQSVTKVNGTGTYRIRYHAYQNERARFNELVTATMEQMGIGRNEAEERIFRAYFSHDLRPLVRSLGTTAR